MVNKHVVRGGSLITVSGMYSCPHCQAKKPLRKGWRAWSCRACFVGDFKGWVLVEPLPDGHVFPRQTIAEHFGALRDRYRAWVRRLLFKPPKTTAGVHGIVSSFTRPGFGKYRLISTCFHPNGCFQSAVFANMLGRQILGYRLALSAKAAVDNHVAILSEIVGGDPKDWASWTMGYDTVVTRLELTCGNALSGDSVVHNYQLGIELSGYLDERLAEAGFDGIIKP